MDAIDTFLDAMFVPYPATPRLLEAKGELRAMMEDAYADAIGRGKTHNEAVGQVITDFGNLEELAPALGILPDIRSAGDAGAAGPAATGTGDDADDGTAGGGGGGGSREGGSESAKIRSSPETPDAVAAPLPARGPASTPASDSDSSSGSASSLLTVPSG